MKLLAIDPGDVQSAYVIVGADRRPIKTGKVPNDELRTSIRSWVSDRLIDHVAIEMIASYGMPVGREVFETCVWIGRFQEAAVSAIPVDATLTLTVAYRRDVKLHHCHDSRAKDSNIAQALVDRFAPGQPNKGKGTKAEPGWFHGFAADIWQAYALGVYVADQTAGYQP
jgi:hypothetical protein